MNEAVSKPSDILEEGSSTQSSGTVVPQVNSETVDSSVLNGDPYENSSHKQENENLTPKKVVILDPAFGQDPDSEEDDSVSHAAGRSKAIATENAATSTSGQITDPSIAAAEDRKKAREERRKEREKKKEEEMLKKYHAEQEAKQKISAKSKCGRWIKHNLKLGKGGYKFVYRGYDTMEAKNIAWCEFKREHVDTREKRQAMFRETEIMLKMNHPHIVRCFDVFREWIDMEDPNNPMEEKGVVIIQELMEGGTLKSAIRKNFSEGHCILKFSLITRWWHQILDALRYMHHRIQPPILHRDLKADNCFLYGAADGECLNVKVGDFGLATHVNNSGRKTMLGTLGFMAPEIFDENYDEKVDIYAFGMLMLEVMTNRTPYDECETVMQVAAKTMSGRGPDIMDKVMNPTLREVIGACIHPLTCFRPTAEELYFHPLFQPKTLLVEVEPNYDVERNEVFDRFIRSLAQPETRNPNFNLRLRFRDKKMLQELGLDDGESLEFDLDIYKAEDQDIPDLIHNLRLCYEDKLSRVFENPKQPDKKIVSSHLDKLFNSIRLQMQFLVKILLGKRWKQILDSLIQELQTRKKPEGSSAAAEGNDSDTDEGTSSFTLIGQYKTRWGRAKRMLEREIQAYRNGTTTVAPSTTIPSTQPSTTVSTVLANVQAKSVTSDPASSTLSNPITLQPSVNVIGATEETDSSSRGPVAVTTVGKFLISTPVSPSVGPSATPVQSGSPDLPSDPTQTQQTEPQLQTITATIPSQSLADALNETRPVQQLLSGAPPAQPVSLVSTASSQSYTQPLTTTLESQPLATDMDSASPAALDGVAQSAALLHQLLQGITASSSKGADPSHADVKQALAQLGTLAPQPGVVNQNSQAAQQQQQQQLLLATAAMVAAAEQTAPHTSSSSAAPTESEVQYAPHEKILHTQTGGSESIAAQQQQQLPPVNPSQVAAAQQPSNMDEVTSPTESQSAAEASSIIDNRTPTSGFPPPVQKVGLQPVSPLPSDPSIQIHLGRQSRTLASRYSVTGDPAFDQLTTQRHAIDNYKCPSSGFAGYSYAIVRPDSLTRANARASSASPRHSHSEDPPCATIASKLRITTKRHSIVGPIRSHPSSPLVFSTSSGFQTIAETLNRKYSMPDQMDRKPRKKSRSKPRHVLRVTKVERDPEGSEQGTLRPTFYLEMPDPENPNSELWKLSFRCNLSDTTEDIKLFEGHTRVNQEIDRAAKEAIVQILGALRSDVNSVKINQDYIFYPHPVTLSSAENVVSGGQPSAGLPHSIPPVQFSVPPQIATNPNITPVDAQSEPSQPAILPPFFSVAPVTPSYDAPTVSQSKQPHQSNLSVDSNMPFLQHPISEVDAHSTEGEEVGENLPMYTSLEPHLIHQPYENIPDPASFPRPAEAASYTPYFSASSCSSSQGIPLLQNIPAPSSHFEQPASKASQLALGLQYVQDLLSSLIGRSVDQGKAAPSEEQLSLEEVASVIPAVLNEPVIASLPSYDSSSQADINTSECTSYSRVDSRSVNLQPDTNVTAPAQPTVYASVPFSQLPVSNMMVNLNCTVPAKMELVLKEVVYRLCNAPHLPHVVLPTGSRTTDTSHATPSLKVVDIPDGHIFLGSGHDGCFNLTTFKSPSDPAFVLLGDSRTSGDLSSPHLYRIPPDSAVVLSPNGAVHYLNKAALVVPGHSHEIHRGASVSTSPVSELTDGTRPSQYSSSVHVRELPIQPNMDNLTIDDVLNLLLALRSTPQSFRRSNNTSPTSEAGFLSSPPLATDPHASVSTFSRRGSVLSGPIHISQQALQEHQLSLGQQLRSLQSHFHGQTGSFLPAEQGFPVVCQSHAFKPTQPSSIEAQNMQVGPIHREWSVDHTASRQNSVHMGTSVVPLNMRNLQHSSTVAIGATPGVHYPSQSRQPSRHQILPQSGARDLNVTALQRAIQILSSLNSSLPYDQLHNVNHPIPRVQTTHSAFVPNLTHPQMRGPPSSTRPVAPSQPSGCTSPPSHPPSASSQFRLFNPVGFAPSDSALDLSAAVSASLDPGRPPTSHPVHPSVVSANPSSQLSATQLRKQPSAFELHSASQQQSLSSLAGLQQMIHPDLLNALLLIQKQSEVHRDMLANLPSDQQSRVISNTVQSQAGRVPSQQPGSTAHSSVLQVAPGGAQAGGSDFSKIQATDQRQQSNTPGSTIPTAPITVANKFTVVPVKSENEEPVIPSVLPNNMLQPPPRPPRQRPAVSQAVPNANPSSVAVDLGSYTALGSAPTTSAISPSLVPNAVPSSGIAVKPPSDDQQSITQVKPLQAKATIDPRNQLPQSVTGTNPQNRSTSSTMPQPSTHPPTRPS